MPIYEYQCLKCKKIHEVSQSMSDPPLAKCPSCRGKVEKLLSLSGFQLKGGGWYKDGYSSPSKPAVASPTPTDTAPASAPVEKSEKKEAAKPEKKEKTKKK